MAPEMYLFTEKRTYHIPASGANRKVRKAQLNQLLGLMVLNQYCAIILQLLRKPPNRIRKLAALEPARNFPTLKGEIAMAKKRNPKPRIIRTRFAPPANEW
jgi:hypothetical protein